MKSQGQLTDDLLMRSIHSKKRLSGIIYQPSVIFSSVISHRRSVIFSSVIFCFLFNCQLSAQTFAVTNANDEYVVTSLKGSERYKYNIKEVIRDKNGLYWFQNLNSISSFDGINWKDYVLKDINGRNVSIRINEIEVTDDSTIWLCTAQGLYGYNRRSERFVLMKEIYPELSKIPTVTNCIYKGINNFALVSIIKDGFYVFDWKSGSLKYVAIDSTEQIQVSISQTDLDVTSDREGNYWGLTRQRKGIWFYNATTGEIKCSWKGEVLQQAAKRLDGIRIESLKYSRKENALLISYGNKGILEKLYLSTGKSTFYSFYGDLNVRADTNSKKRYPIIRVNVDRNGDEWVLLGKYLVILDPDVSKFKFLENDPDLLPLGRINWLLPEADLKTPGGSRDQSLLWMTGDRGLSLLKKRNSLVRQLHYEEKSADGITPDDYLNRDFLALNGDFYNMFFLKGPGSDYILLQLNPGRPKLIRFNKELRITGSLLNDQWKNYPAYIGHEINEKEFYISILRQGNEPIDFREVVIKDFRIDLQSMNAVETPLTFAERVWRLGARDEANVYWLFSDGFLYSYDPRKKMLDSIFICVPGSKKSYQNSRIKGFDFPTVLNKKTSTFWISFIADQELYKVNLQKRRVEKIIRGCTDQRDFSPAFKLYEFDSSRIYLKRNLSAAFLNPVNDAEKIIRGYIDLRDGLPGSAFQLSEFDSSRIYLKLNLSAALLNPVNDSIVIFSDLFQTKLPDEDYVASGIYRDWLCNITATQINLVNTATRRQKRLSLNQDFKWPISAQSSPPLVNDRGEMILMSSYQRGFVLFNLDSILYPPGPGIVQLAYLKLDEKNLPLDSIMKQDVLRLKYNQYNSIQFRFSDYSLANQEQVHYEYALYSSGDTLWTRIDGDPDLSFSKISPGNYKLLIRASNGFGEYSPKISVLNIVIIPPFTQTIWFIMLLVAGVTAILYGFYRYRLKQVKRLQVIRNNIASDLHDDIGSTLNSISIYSEVAKQQAGKELPALDLIGQNSRKIIDSMSDIVWTINPENDSFEKIITRMRSFAYNILRAKNVEYSFEVDEKLNGIQLPMQVRKNFYLIFKEAVNNLVKYSKASTAIISIYERNKVIVLSIYDNGVGIQGNPDAQGNGLLNMRRRANEISADLVIESENGDGTKVEVKLKA